jgi:hypothetical protein
MVKWEDKQRGISVLAGRIETSDMTVAQTCLA